MLGLAVYLVTGVVGLADYPIFFCDEAVQTNLAADFVRDGYRWPCCGVAWPSAATAPVG